MHCADAPRRHPWALRQPQGKRSRGMANVFSGCPRSPRWSIAVTHAHCITSVKQKSVSNPVPGHSNPSAKNISYPPFNALARNIGNRMKYTRPVNRYTP